MRGKNSFPPELKKLDWYGLVRTGFATLPPDPLPRLPRPRTTASLERSLSELRACALQLSPEQRQGYAQAKADILFLMREEEPAEISRALGKAIGPTRLGATKPAPPKVAQAVSSVRERLEKKMRARIERRRT